MSSFRKRSCYFAQTFLVFLQLAHANIRLLDAFSLACPSVLPQKNDVATSPSQLLGNKPFFADFPVEGSSSISAEKCANDDNNQVGFGKTAVIAGATGYIGRACVRECVSRGYYTIALVRDPSSASSDEALNGSSLVKCDVTNEPEVKSLLEEIASGSDLGVSPGNEQMSIQSPPPIDVIISCLASPSGVESEVYAIDYQSSLNLLNAGRSSTVNARHYVLLSAFCCRNPILKLQQAKLKFEGKLAEQTEMTYSIVRPTAFFKSVSGQYESILQGNSYVLFGDGSVTQCNPIAEEDLAIFMCDSAIDETKWGRILNVGGPDEPLSNKMLGEVSTAK